MADSGLTPVYTRTMAAAETVTLTQSTSTTYVSVLCLTDNSGAAGVSITGTANLPGSATANAITLTAGQSITVSAPPGYQIQDLTITTGASSTATLIAV